MSLKVQKIVEPVVLGEGPHWDAKKQVLYFVDIDGCTINKYTPSTGEHAKTKLNGRPGFIIPVEGVDNQFVVGLETTFLVLEWDGVNDSSIQIVRDLGTVDKEVRPSPRINDGKADPRGRLFAGTMGAEEKPGQILRKNGSFYRIDSRGIKKMCGDIDLSNGLAWDVKGKALYYTDSLEYKIRRYDYDIESGEITNMKYVFDLKANDIEGIPDGTTIDTDGNLWVAVFNGGCVLQIDPRKGKVLRKLAMPVPQITSVTFGGPHHDVLFVTSANIIFADSSPDQYPCGATFMVTGLEVQGYPNVNFQLN